MALDATKGNRAKENFSLSVDYSEIYNTCNENDIRKLLAMECFIIDSFAEKFTSAQKQDILNYIEDFNSFSDKELANQRNKRSEVLKSMLKPDFEVLSYTFADDNSIGLLIKSNKSNLTENIIYKLKPGISLSDYITNLTQDLSDIQNKQIEHNSSKSTTASTKKANKIRKDLSILEQVENMEKNK